MRVTKVMLEEKLETAHAAVDRKNTEIFILREKVTMLHEVINLYKKTPVLIDAAKGICDSLAHTVDVVSRRMS